MVKKSDCVSGGTNGTCIHCGSGDTTIHSNPENDKLRLKCKGCGKTFMPHSHQKKRLKKKAAADIAMEIYNAEHRELIADKLNVKAASGVVLSYRAIAKIVGCSPETIKTWLANHDNPICKPATDNRKAKYYGEHKTGSPKQCRRCDGSRIVKNGKPDNVQRYLCKDCGHQYVVQEYDLALLVDILNHALGYREYYACHYLAGYDSFRKCQYQYKCPFPKECTTLYKCPKALTGECPYPDSDDCPYAGKCDYVLQYADELTRAFKCDVEARKE